MDAFQRWNYIPETMFDVDLSGEDKLGFNELLSSIRERRDQTGTYKALAYGEFLVFNYSGSQKPIFWCFNSWVEPFLLVHQLTNDHPLIAAISPNLYVNKLIKKARYTEPLAKRYLDGVLHLFGTKDLIIGGNCQGGPIAESVCIQLAEQENIYQPLITVGYISRRKYSGTRLMLFGSDSPYNPFRYKLDPIPYWQERLESFQWELIETDHGKYFKEPAIIRIKECILGLG